MQPVLIDLSRFNPFGLDLRSWMWDNRWLVTALIVAILIALSFLHGRRQKAGRGGEIAGIVSMVLLTLIIAAAVMTFAKINSYGLMMALGFMAGIVAARWRAKRVGENPDVITTLGMLALVAGVVGARLSYVIEHWRDFNSVVDAARLTSGGLVFDGGLILAVVTTLVYLWRKKLPVRRFLDILAISAMIGLAFGRVGCLLNGCCFGGVCKDSFPLAIHFPYSAPPLVYPHEGDSPYPDGAVPSPVYGHQVDQGQLTSIPPELVAHRDGAIALKMPDQLVTPRAIEAAREAHSLAVQPAQVYGIANALVIAGILAVFFRLRRFEGQVFVLLLVLYPIGRFVLERIRDDNAGMTLTPAQVKCIVILAVGVVMMLAVRKLPASCGPTWSQRMALAEAAKPPAKPKNRRR